MEFLEKVDAREHLVYDELSRLAEPHVNARPDLFTLFSPEEAEKHPGQSLGTWHIEGNPQDVGTVEVIAKEIEPRFSVFTDKLDELEQSHGEISRLGENLRERQNIIVVTNHGDLKDIAYTLAAYYMKLKEKDYDFSSELVMSKIISFIGIKMGEHVVPAVNILKNICDQEYFSFPRTRSIAESKIASPLVDAYNLRVRKSMQRQLGKGQNLFAMAASGTTDKPRPGDADTIIMGTISHGTAKLMTTENSLVVPAAVWVDEDGIMFEPCDIPRAVKSEAEAHQIMEKIAQSLNKRVPFKQFVYDNPARALGKISLNS